MTHVGQVEITGKHHFNHSNHSDSVTQMLSLIKFMMNCVMNGYFLPSYIIALAYSIIKHRNNDMILIYSTPVIRFHLFKNKYQNNDADIIIVITFNNILGDVIAKIILI